MLVFGYLLYCAVPTLYWGDSAEMASVSCDMGVAHSPGYPFYTQLTRLFSGLPFDSMPFGVNLLSAFLGSLAVVFIYWTILELTGSLFAALVAAFGVVGCRAFVFHSLFAEVYPLHLFLFSAVMFLLARQARNGGGREIIFALLLLFAGTTHHLLMVFVFGAVLLYLVLLPGHRWRVVAGPLVLLLGAAMINLFMSFNAMPLLTRTGFWVLVAIAVVYVLYLVVLGIKTKGLLSGLTAALLALLMLAVATLLYAYLPAASARGPIANWWSPENPVNFLKLLMLQGYESTVPANRVELLQRLDLISFPRQVSYLMMGLAVPGMIFMFRKNWRYALMLLTIGAGTLAGSLFVTHGKPEALRTPVYLSIIMFSGIGAAALPSWRFFRGAKWRRAPACVVVAGIIVVTFLNLQDSDWRFMNRSNGAYQMGRRILDDVRSNSFLFIGTQSPSIMGYFTACEYDELRRKEIVIVPVSFLPFEWELNQLRKQYPGIVFPSYDELKGKKPIFRVDDPARVRYAVRLIEANPGKAIYSDFLFLNKDAGYVTVPSGTVYRVLDYETPQQSIDEFISRDRQPEWMGISPKDELSGRNLASIHNERGKIYLEFGYETGKEEYMRKALDEFNRALEFDDKFASAMSNKGQCLIYYQQPERGIEMMNDAIRLDPSNPVIYETLATMKFRQQRPSSVQEAIALWKVSYALDPHNARALNNIGSALVGIQARDEAIAYYRMAAEVDPGYISSYINMSRVYNQMGICSLAVEALELARDRNPDDIGTWSELAQQYHDCNMKHLYAEVVQEMVERFPHNEGFYYTVAIIFRNVGQFNNLARAVEELMKLDPEFPIQNIFTPRQACDMKAIEAISETIKRMPEQKQLYLTKTILYGHCDMFEEGQKVVEEAIKKFPDVKEFRDLLEKLKTPLEMPENFSVYDMVIPPGDQDSGEEQNKQ